MPEEISHAVLAAVDHSSTTAKRYYRGTERYYRLGDKKTTQTRSSKLPEGNVGAYGVVYVLIPPIPFQSGPPLNSTVFLRLNSIEKETQEKHRLHNGSERHQSSCAK